MRQPGGGGALLEVEQARSEDLADGPSPVGSSGREVSKEQRSEVCEGTPTLFCH